MADKPEPDYPINELVRVRIGTGKDAVEKNMGRALAESLDDVEILDESIRDDAGQLRDETRADGRPVKPKTTVADAAAAKKTAAKSTADENKE